MKRYLSKLNHKLNYKLLANKKPLYTTSFKKITLYNLSLFSVFSLFSSQVVYAQDNKITDPALNATVVLLKRQACLDFMNYYTNSLDYEFAWQDPSAPLIGVFKDKVLGFPGCGQISLPVDPGKSKPHEDFIKVISNKDPKLPGMIEILSANLTRQIANNKTEVDLNPFFTTCVMYDKKITKNSDINNKYIRSFGAYKPDYPLAISSDAKQLEKFMQTVDFVIKNAVARGCDGSAQAPTQEIKPEPKADLDSSKSGLDLLGEDKNAGNLKDDLSSGYNDLGNFGSLQPWDPRLSTGGGSSGGGGSGGGGASSAAGTQGVGGVAGIPGAGGAGGTIGGPDIVNGSGGSTSISSSGSGSSSSSSSSVVCDASTPNCKDTNNPNSNCPPGDTDCTDDTGGDNSTVDQNNGGVLNAVNRPIKNIFRYDMLLIDSNMQQYAPQTGFIYSLQSPVGEVHTVKISTGTGGATQSFDVKTLCEASVDECRVIHQSWFNYSVSRQAQQNLRLDTGSIPLDQSFWLPRQEDWVNIQAPLFINNINSALGTNNASDRDNQLPQAPYGNN